MATREMLRVIVYDIAENRRRSKVADLLEEVAVRVQLSVFEARLSHAEAQALFRRLARHLDKGDRLRLYTIDAAGLNHSAALGGPPIPEKEDFWLL